ncbi:helix-turn-helix domain-containing protein [Salinirubellus salinus]|uniref:Helix-turn-helix domain-containing protein n=1 Tax=Salinirubellus salinus TaxID=1364945 RepID=A0A9E7R6W6_9EURY|nr:helix-turn-helix domain-containing protein [Salinirubellus salinus]UWM56697.1 helix-turn-helix domain-containing protein [Salinirubellus salinus]
MAIVAELEIPADTFDLGRVTSVGGPIHLELERVVPSGGEVMPFFWATDCPDFERFERRVREERLVEELTAVVQFDDQVLYHVVWGETTASLTRALVATDATILEARGNDPWEFQLRFRDRDDLRAFADHCRETGIEVDLQRVYELSGPSPQESVDALTDEQRAALVAAVSGGYFEVPRRTTLGAVADELGISQQATSERVRRAADRVLRGALSITEE